MTSIALNQQQPQRALFAGGRVVERPTVTNVFWDAGVQNRDTLDRFMRYALQAPRMAGLAEFSTQNHSIGAGALAGSVTLAGQSGNGGAVQSDTITNTLTTLIENGTLPSPDDNQLAMVYMPPGVGVIDANHYACNLVAACPPNETCDYFCGYTSAFPLGNQTAHYAVVMTDPTCLGCFSGSEVTETASAQLTNFATNPLGDAWHAVDGTPVANMCDASAWADGYRLTSLWSIVGRRACLLAPRRSTTIVLTGTRI